MWHRFRVAESRILLLARCLMPKPDLTARGLSRDTHSIPLGSSILRIILQKDWLQSRWQSITPAAHPVSHPHHGQDREGLYTFLLLVYIVEMQPHQRSRWCCTLGIPWNQAAHRKFGSTDAARSTSLFSLKLSLKKQQQEAGEISISRDRVLVLSSSTTFYRWSLNPYINPGQHSNKSLQYPTASCGNDMTQKAASSVHRKKNQTNPNPNQPNISKQNIKTNEEMKKTKPVLQPVNTFWDQSITCLGSLSLLCLQTI